MIRQQPFDEIKMPTRTLMGKLHASTYSNASQHGEGQGIKQLTVQPVYLLVRKPSRLRHALNDVINTSPKPQEPQSWDEHVDWPSARALLTPSHFRTRPSNYWYILPPPATLMLQKQQTMVMVCKSSRNLQLGTATDRGSPRKKGGCNSDHPFKKQGGGALDGPDDPISGFQSGHSKRWPRPALFCASIQTPASQPTCAPHHSFWPRQTTVVSILTHASIPACLVSTLRVDDLQVPDLQAAIRMNS